MEKPLTSTLESKLKEMSFEFWLELRKDTNFNGEADSGQPWEGFIKASIPPFMWAIINSSLSKYSNECLQQTKRRYKYKKWFANMKDLNCQYSNERFLRKFYNLEPLSTNVCYAILNFISSCNLTLWTRCRNNALF